MAGLTAAGVIAEFALIRDVAESADLRKTRDRGFTPY
jgi:hypothetical protein